MKNLISVGNRFFFVSIFNKAIFLKNYSKTENVIYLHIFWDI